MEPETHEGMIEYLNKSFIGPGPRYPGPRGPGVRMPQQVEFNAPGNVPGQPMMPSGMDPSRQVVLDHKI
ncbi:hypothetical protein NPIL_483441 [Nephila pilipes]|uniref:Uncharacterized protein n=1 Tax=Nephila pilipes TaxID=299642 RepID=A0A8X6QWV8_NEPPI|nr:hypothetical protein NPIL_483441 [Nephila pilipes]